MTIEAKRSTIATIGRAAPKRNAPPNQLFERNELACCERYLLDAEGAAFSSSFGKERAKLVIEFSRNETLQTRIKESDRRNAAEMLRECLDEIETRMSGRREGGLDLMPAAVHLFKAMPPGVAVRTLDTVQHRMATLLTRHQSVLLHSALREVRASIDRLTALAALRKPESIVSIAMAEAGLDARPDGESIAQELTTWLSAWGRISPMQIRTLDFEFFRQLMHSIDHATRLSPEEWRILVRQVVFSVEERINRNLDEDTFALFQTLARFGSRMAFVRNLRVTHGRALRLLDDDLVDWILVQTLIGESRAQHSEFIYNLDTERLRRIVDFEVDELREFFSTLLNKVRPDHERHELDWLQDVGERLCMLLEDAEALAVWKSAADAEAPALASTIAAESSERIAASGATRTIQQIITIILRAVTAADQSADAVQAFRRLATVLAGCESERPIWRNTQRIAAQLGKLERPASGTVGARLDGVLRALSEFKPARPSEASQLRDIWSAVPVEHTALASEYIFCALGAERPIRAKSLVRLAAADVLAGRAHPDNILNFLNSGFVEQVASSLGLARDEAERLIEQGRNESTVLGLLAVQQQMAVKFAGNDNKARQRLRRIITLLARLPGNKTPRVGEEWQIWIGPEVHWLLDNHFPAESESWSRLNEELQAKLSIDQQRGIAQFFRSLLGYGMTDTTKPRSAVPDEPLALRREDAPNAPSEPYRHFVQELLAKLSAETEIDWRSAWFDALEQRGCVHGAWHEVLPALEGAVENRGLSVVEAELDHLETRLAAQLDATSAAFWVQLICRLRSAARRITIGRRWIDDAGLLARRAVASASNAGVGDRESPIVLSALLADTVRHMGQMLTRQPGALLALELPRFWLANVLPQLGADTEFPIRFVTALTAETRSRVPDECQALLVEWTGHLGQAAARLVGCIAFAEQILQSQEHLFAEDKKSEAAWRSFLGGLIVAAAVGPAWPGSRSELCQELIEASPNVAQLPPATWKSSSGALIKRLRHSLDDRILPELITCQTEIGKALTARQQLGHLNELEADIRGWCRRPAGQGHRRLWQQYVIASSRTFGTAHQSFIDVAQLNDWPLPDETNAKSQTNLLRSAFQAATKTDPNTLRTGLLKRSVPKISERGIEAVRAIATEYALAVACGDEYAQRSALVQLCTRSLSDWSYDDLLRFIETIDCSIYEQSLTKREAEERRSRVAAQAWLGEKLASQGPQWIEGDRERGGWGSKLNRSASQGEVPLDELAFIHTLSALAMQGGVPFGDDPTYRARAPRIDDPTQQRRLKKLLRAQLPKSVHAFCEAAAAELLTGAGRESDHA